jgi:hypothetical protein
VTIYKFELPGFIEDGELMCDRPALLEELNRRGLNIVDFLEFTNIEEIKMGEQSYLKFTVTETP